MVLSFLFLSRFSDGFLSPKVFPGEKAAPHCRLRQSGVKMMVLGEDDRRQPRLWEILRQSGVKMIVGNLLMEIEMTSTVGNIQVMKKS